MTDQDLVFADAFKALTGHSPLSWQVRLFDDFGNRVNECCSVIDLPTGMGKTAIMAIWLIARAWRPDKIPTRLIYVVDRRTVVDQATDNAEEFAYLLAPDGKDESRKIAKRKPELIERKEKYADALARLRATLSDTGLAISTLRGQLADNREWSRDLSRPAIIIGTVDLIGSALLFSGYRSSYKRRPLEAGLLGQDSLLVLDEAHLSKPFEKLICAIGDDGSSRKDREANPQGKPMCILRMSATSGTSADSKPFFTLQFDANGNLEGEDAKDKTIADRFGAKKTLSVVEAEKPIEAIATEADKLATTKPGSRIVIFVQTPRQVADVRKTLEKKSKGYATRTAQLTGTMRGLERDELVTPPTDESQHERRVMQRFLRPENDPSLGVCFLISTSAGEVGFDLNADHLVCDATTIDSLIQRLGRVNRRGWGDAEVHLFFEPPKEGKNGKSGKLEGRDLAIANTTALLRYVTDVSPKNIAALKANEWKDTYTDACTPPVATVELTDILLDNWSMTSIIEPMPGRPEVGPWLRGIADALPQTTIAWRAELDLPGFDQLDPEDVEEWFDTHRILTHEILSVPTHVAAKWLTDRWGKLSEAQQRDVGARSLLVDRAGLKLVTVKDLIDQLSRKSGDTTAPIRNADLTLPASFGGIERGRGLLDADAPAIPKNEDQQPTSPDVADERGRCRQLVTKTDEGDPTVESVGTGNKPAKPSKLVLTLESDDDRRVQLISFVPKLEKLELGSRKQTLSEHVGLVRKRVEDILNRLDLPDSIKRAAELAADFHDHGKNRERWQRLVKGEATPAGQDWLDATLGKSGGDMKRDSRGYRHEFGSLREFIDAHQGKIEPEIFDLAMHLIAVHHGRGRPHFSKGGFDPDCETRSDEIHTESIRRFARLQRKYGHWHLAWLENLLRCADAMASADQDAEDDAAGAEGGEQ